MVPTAHERLAPPTKQGRPARRQFRACVGIKRVAAGRVFCSFTMMSYMDTLRPGRARPLVEGPESRRRGVQEGRHFARPRSMHWASVNGRKRKFAHGLGTEHV